MRISRLDINSTFPINAKISNCFATSYSYDFNGNITNLRRYDNGGNLLHSINYGYEDRRNRLGSINVTGSDISSSSYRYDALGNLITDTIESIQIDWNVIGKVKSVQTPNNFLQFAYNPFGQRQIKRTDNNTTYYIHDATGNVMGIYIKDDLTLTTKERPIYGSSRIGILNKYVEFDLTGNFLSKSNSTIGIKEYELSDHLGNVSVVILDRKIFDGDKFAATSLSRTDYYPFGYPIASRSFSLEQYRFGFNGQEGDDEIYGDNKCYSYEFRSYDSRIGRWWSIDKMSTKYSNLSPYSFTNNNPIINLEINGKDFILSVYKRDGKNYITIKQTIYPQNSAAAAELNNAVKEFKNLTKIVKIDNVEYIVNFEITVVEPPIIPEGQTIENQNLATLKNFTLDPYGNYYFQYANEYNKQGETAGGACGNYFKMFRVLLKDDYGEFYGDGIDFPELMVHEILHLFGLTDKGGDYYDPNGRMFYNFNQRERK